MYTDTPGIKIQYTQRHNPPALSWLFVLFDKFS